MHYVFRIWGTYVVILREIAVLYCNVLLILQIFTITSGIHPSLRPSIIALLSKCGSWLIHHYRTEWTFSGWQYQHAETSTWTFIFAISGCSGIYHKICRISIKKATSIFSRNVYLYECKNVYLLGVYLLTIILCSLLTQKQNRTTFC